MQSVSVNNISSFMKLFLASLEFDEFSVIEISISTYSNFHIDGRLNKEYFDTEDKPESDYCGWKTLRPICFELIKGKILPLKMNFVLALPKSLTGKLLCENGISLSPDDVDFLVNIRYENNTLSLISATNTKSFSLDKSHEKAWDEAFEKGLSRYDI